MTLLVILLVMLQGMLLVTSLVIQQVSHTGGVDANNTRILNVADPVDTTDGLSLGYFNQVLSGSEQGIAGSLADARDARDDAQGYRDETEGFRTMKN